MRVSKVWLVSFLLLFAVPFAVAKDTATAKTQNDEESKTESAESDSGESENAESKNSASKNGKPKNGKPDSEAPADELSVTNHETTIGGVPIRYTATAGTLVMKADDAKKKAKASIFFVAYTKDDVQDVARRPLTFCFNGGPGSSAVWLHLGLLGPLHVPVNDDASLSPARPVLKQNPYSMLDQTDLVFVDPVNTGYS
ncbi:MAG: hypothetical protein WBF93_21340, partial [Pirellulales bacterium]